MKGVQWRFAWVLSLTVSWMQLQAQLPAFPGAEGYGKLASGGRGNGQTGRVVAVTNLEDALSNPPSGSFRWALAQGVETVIHPILGPLQYKRPLTVVFRVGGVINLKGELRINRSNLTIAGQTAPGGGICIRGATVNFSGSRNVIIRYLRFRPGDELGLETSAFRIENGGNFIIDHCSMSWAIEETTHFSANDSTTVQWCIISESLYNSIHKKGERGYGTQWGGEYASYHHNLLAHHNSRMPRINGSSKDDIEALVDYRNNVNYNWGSTGAFYGGEWENTGGKGFCHTNVVNNYFKPGPATPGTRLFARPSLNRSGVPLDGYGKWYFSGNAMEGSSAMTADNWLGVDASSVGGAANIRSESEFLKTDGLFENYAAYTQTAAEAFVSVLGHAGAALPRRDAIDNRIVLEIKGEIPVVRYAYTTREGQSTPVKGVASGIIDTQNNLVPPDAPSGSSAWDVYNFSDNAPADSDGDGIPDDWETARGLDKSNPADGRLIADNGYSNLENFLNGLDTLTRVRVTGNEGRFRIYPNPAGEELFFYSSRPVQELKVIDLRGRMLLYRSDSRGIRSLDVGALRPGLYLVAARTSEGIVREKFVKQ